jgi:catechol 2,3-dioxygenase
MTKSPKPKLAHFGLYVRDIERMVDFYTRVFGLTITDRGNAGLGRGELVFMSADPGEHHQLVLVAGRTNEMQNSAIQQISLLVYTLEELHTLYERICADSREIDRAVTHGNAWSVYFFDPEKNRVEFYCHTPWHVPQPHAFPIDFSQSIKEIERITEEHCRATKGFMLASERTAVMEQLLQREN